MKQFTSLVAMLTLSLAACAADESGNGGGAETDDSSRAVRSAEATSEVITLSADFAVLGGAAARSSVAEFDLQRAVDDIIGADCGQVELTDTQLTVELSGCPGLSGSIEITFPDAGCIDPSDPDPSCLDDLDVTVTSTLEVEGIAIVGTFDNLITEDGCVAEGTLEVDVDGDELDVDFDIEITEDAASDCELINGSLAVTSADGSVTVVADNLLDCGDCPESGSLRVEADGESVVVDFDDGNISVSGADGEQVDAVLTCDDAF